MGWTLLGVPLHPLIVHAAVVFIPLAAIAGALYVGSERARLRWWPLLTGIVATAWLASLLAGSSGESLQHAMRSSHLIDVHTMYASWLGVSVHVLAGAFLVRLAADQASQARMLEHAPWAVLRPLASTLCVAAAACAIVLVGMTGHAGAKAAWHGIDSQSHGRSQGPGSQ